MTNLRTLARKKEPIWAIPADPILVGKDIMELLSCSMYIDPMSIYLEYVQNAADAIDEAKSSSSEHQGQIHISIDPLARVVLIRDNGCGISQSKFVQRLTAFGASKKRGTTARGFRGVGRLAGIGYCQELIFRSRACGERYVSELRWDCRKLKTMLRSTEYRGSLEELVYETVTHATTTDAANASSFFEVELRGIIRHKDDALLSPDAVDEYLSQIAPVPFSPEFPFGAAIGAHLNAHLTLGNLSIVINRMSSIYRPHRATFEVRAGLTDTFTELQPIEIKGDDGPVAVGWFLHHGYQGALPPRVRVGGIRLRCGDIQIGSANIIEDLVPEPRFNAWCVGELHILDRRIVPNGRRDHFEQNTPLHELLNQIAPYTRALTHRARPSSLHRKH